MDSNQKQIQINTVYLFHVLAKLNFYGIECMCEPISGSKFKIGEKFKMCWSAHANTNTMHTK